MFVVLNTAYSSGGSGGGVSVYLYSVMELFCLLTLELLAVHHTRTTHISLSLSAYLKLTICAQDTKVQSAVHSTRARSLTLRLCRPIVLANSIRNNRNL